MTAAECYKAMFEAMKEVVYELRAELQAEPEHASRLVGDLHEMWVHEAEQESPFPNSLELYNKRNPS